jgi:hypothetical protein
MHACVCGFDCVRDCVRACGCVRARKRTHISLHSHATGVGVALPLRRASKKPRSSMPAKISTESNDASTSNDANAIVNGPPASRSHEQSECGEYLRAHVPGVFEHSVRNRGLRASACACASACRGHGSGVAPPVEPRWLRCECARRCLHKAADTRASCGQASARISQAAASLPTCSVGCLAADASHQLASAAPRPGCAPVAGATSAEIGST